MQNFLDSDNIVLLGRMVLEGRKVDTPFNKFKVVSGN